MVHTVSPQSAVNNAPAAQLIDEKVWLLAFTDKKSWRIMQRAIEIWTHRVTRFRSISPLRSASSWAVRYNTATCLAFALTKLSSIAGIYRWRVFCAYPTTSRKRNSFKRLRSRSLVQFFCEVICPNRREFIRKFFEFAPRGAFQARILGDFCLLRETGHLFSQKNCFLMWLGCLPRSLFKRLPRALHMSNPGRKRTP
jgi:hypothetical protein